MVLIPEELARSILAGDCILWAGAGLGSLTGRPTWEELLRRLVPACSQGSREHLEDLLEQGRLRTVLTYVHRHLGDEPLANLLKEVAAESKADEIDARARGLARMPWRACFATTYPDVVAAVFASAGLRPAVLSHQTVHDLSLRDQNDFFILKTPPTGRNMRADAILFDLVEEVVRTRHILFLGFEPDDPDLQQILDLVDRIGRGNQHFAMLPFVSAPEAEEWKDRFGIEVIHLPEEPDYIEVIESLQEGTRNTALRPSGVEGKLHILDLSRAVRPVGMRGDLALDSALTIDRSWIEELISRVPGGGTLADVPAATLLRAGSVMLAHGRVELARRCFQQVVGTIGEGELMNVARFNLSLAFLADGDRDEALEGLSRAAEVDRSLAIVPPRFELLEIHGQSGSQLFLTCRDRTNAEEVDVEVSTLGRVCGGDERKQFTAAVHKVVAIDHPALCRVRGGFADGRLFGVMTERTPGFILSDTLRDADPMTLPQAWEIVEPLVHALTACHRQGVLHRNLTPHQVLLSPQGARLRGFGFPPVVGARRPSVRLQAHGFMAPEVFEGADQTELSDAYAVSAILYLLLTGRLPVGSVPSPASLDERHDPRLGPVFRDALHPDPTQRLGVEALGAEVDRILRTPEEGRMAPLHEVDVPAGSERVVEISPESAPASPTLQRIELPTDPEDLEGWAWVMECKPTHAEARAAVEAIEFRAREDGRWDRVADIVRVRIATSQVRHERAEYLQELARISENELGAPGDAFSAVRALFDEVELDRQVVLLDELDRLADATGRWNELADAVTTVAERATDASVQARVYTHLGQVLAEKLGVVDQALAAYRRAIDLEPTRERYEAVVPLWRKSGNVAELAKVLLSLADLQDPEDRHTTLVATARLLREELGEDEAALGVLELVLGEDPTHVDALEAAESIARELERWETLIEVLGRRADAAFDPKEAARLRKEAAELAAEQKQDSSGAIEHLVRITQADHSDVEAARRLVELLRPVVREDLSQRVTLIDTLTILVELVDVAEEKASLLVECATLLDKEPDGKLRAIECRERALEVVAADHEVAVEAARQLEKVYRRNEDYAALERMLVRQGEESDADDAFRFEAWRKLFDLRDDVLEDEAGVVECLERLIELQPEDVKWRDILLERYLRREEFAKAGPLIRAQVAEEKDPIRRAELLLRGGKLRLKIGKVDGAIEALEEAVQLDPALVEGWLLLRDVYDEHGQPLKAAEALVSAGQNESNRVERTKFIYEAARRYMDDLDRPDRATDLLEVVVDLDPDHREATEILLERLLQTDELRRAWPHAQTFVMQVRAQVPSDTALHVRALSVAGRCALAVEAKDRAREYLHKARELDASNFEVLRLLAELELDAGNWDEALRSFQSVALGQGDAMAPSEQSSLYVAMARARKGMNEPTKAVHMLDRALEIDPDNEGAMRLMVEIGTSAGDPASVARGELLLAQSIGRRLEQGSDASEAGALRERQQELLSHVAEVQSTLGQTEAAVETLERLRGLSHDDPAVLHKLLDAHTKLERWTDCVALLERLAASQADGAFKSKYYWAGALLLRDKVEDLDGATEWFRRCLEQDPSNRAAFDAYVGQLDKARAWADKSKAIRLFMKALPKDTSPQDLAGLFAVLGETHERMRDGKTAIAAYDQAARLAAKGGTDLEVRREYRETVIRLGIALGEDELDKAVHHAHALIAGRPMDFDVYHRLIEIYLKQGSRDQAKTVARTLKFLRQADEAELDLASGAPSSPRTPVTRDKWRRGVHHPDADPRLSDVFALVWPMVALREGRTHAHRGVQRSDRVEVTLQSPIALSRYVAHSCQILDVPVPDLFLVDELGGLIVEALAEGSGKTKTVYPSVVAGRAATQDQDERSLAFRAGRAVDRVRPEHILAGLLHSAPSLRYVVYGAVLVANPDGRVPEDARSASEAYARLMKPYLKAARFDQVRALVEPFADGAEPDVRAWLTGIAFTTTRAGFVLSDSMETAAQILTREGDDGSPVAAKERVADLVAYSVSEPYLRLRKQLGLGR